MALLSMKMYFPCFIIENWNHQQADCWPYYKNNRVPSAKPRYFQFYEHLFTFKVFICGNFIIIHSPPAWCVWFLAYRAKLSMLSKVSKIRGNVRPVGYPQTEGILGDCMLISGAQLGVESAFGRFISWNKTHCKKKKRKLHV